MCVTNGHSGDRCEFASILCKYDLRRVFIYLNWGRVRRVKREGISSELLMCVRGVRSI